MALVNHELISENILRITLHDPESLNAMSEAMAVEFRRVCALYRQSNLRAIILTGSGKAFSAGGQLQMLLAKTKLTHKENKQRMLDFYTAFLSIRELGAPIVVGLNGAAVGASLCLACACDLRVAIPQIKMGFPFVKLGLHPGMAATYFLATVVGSSKARELLMTGRLIDSAEALRIGLVNELVAAEALDQRCLELAQELSVVSPHALKMLRATLDAPALDLENCLQREAEAQAQCYAHTEFLEGVSSALEKRPAKF